MKLFSLLPKRLVHLACNSPKLWVVAWTRLNLLKARFR